jgi:hypothetical protein
VREAEDVDNNASESSEGAIGEMQTEYCREKDPGRRVTEQVSDLICFELFVLNAGLLWSHSFNGDRPLFWSEEACCGWVLREKEYQHDTPDDSDGTEDKILVPPWMKLALEVTDPEEQERAQEVC